MAAAALIWWTGHWRRAVFFAVVILAVTAASVVFPAFSRAIDRGIDRFQKVVTRVLSFVVLGAVELFIFAPLSLLLRLSRHDPMALGATAADPSFWRPSVVRKTRPLHRRQFTQESVAHEEGTTRGFFPLLGARAVIGMVVLVLLADVALGGVLNVVRPTTRRQSSGGVQRVLQAPYTAAAAQEPWIGQLADELADVYQQRGFHPFRGWALADYNGKYVHIRNGLRRSYQPSLAPSTKPVEVAFFGGSAMMGWFERDEHTIPSEFARLAEADGINVRPVNYGVPAYVNWQEVMQLQELTSKGQRPDLAVFYDGCNELVSQFNHGPFDEPSHVNAQVTEDRLLGLGEGSRSFARDAGSFWSRNSAVYRLGKGVKQLIRGGGAKIEGYTSPWRDQSIQQRERGIAAGRIYARGVDAAQHLAKSYDFPAAFFWQPLIYTKDKVPGEEVAYGSYGTLAEAWHTADDYARAQFPKQVADLSDSLDGVDAPLMYDFVHTNEPGARVIAKAMYERLRPQLLKLAAER